MFSFVLFPGEGLSLIFQLFKMFYFIYLCGVNVAGLRMLSLKSSVCKDDLCLVSRNLEFGMVSTMPPLECFLVPFCAPKLCKHDLW